jgi:hypothetical protein
MNHDWKNLVTLIFLRKENNFLNVYLVRVSQNFVSQIFAKADMQKPQFRYNIKVASVRPKI